MPDKRESIERHSGTRLNELKDLPIKGGLDRGGKFSYYEIETANNSKATVIVVPVSKKKGLEIRPVVNQPNRRTSEAAGKEMALAAVNAGYFNLKDGLSASFIAINGQQVCDPHNNPALMNNPKLKPHMAEILNRSEVRFLSDTKGHISITIQRHNERVPAGRSLKHAIQAGPRLLPKLTAEEEAFIRKDADGTTTDSIGCLKTAARTAFGITADGNAVILCVSGPKQDEFSSGVTLPQLADLMSKLGCIEAINFDGGTSSTMAIRSDLLAGNHAALNSQLPRLDINREANSEYTLVCGRNPETQVKSCLIIK